MIYAMGYINTHLVGYCYFILTVTDPLKSHTRNNTRVENTCMNHMMMPCWTCGHWSFRKTGKWPVRIYLIRWAGAQNFLGQKPPPPIPQWPPTHLYNVVKQQRQTKWSTFHYGIVSILYETTNIFIKLSWMIGNEFILYFVIQKQQV